MNLIHTSACFTIPSSSTTNKQTNKKQQLLFRASDAARLSDRQLFCYSTDNWHTHARSSAGARQTRSRGGLYVLNLNALLGSRRYCKRERERGFWVAGCVMDDEYMGPVSVRWDLEERVPLRRKGESVSRKLDVGVLVLKKFSCLIVSSWQRIRIRRSCEIWYTS